MMKDPEFRADADKLKLDIDPVSGLSMQKIIDDLYKTPAPVLESIKKILVE